MMHLLCCLVIIEAWFQFKMVAVHNPGMLTSWADDLSRDYLSSFLSKTPELEPELGFSRFHSQDV